MVQFFAELKRRNVVRVALLYAAAAWLVLQVADIAAALLGLPDWTLRFVLFAFLLGFPFVLIFAWVYELTREGLKRESEVERDQSITQVTGRRINVLIVVLLALAIGAVAFDRLIPEVGTDAVVASDRRPSIAVLPFLNLSSDPQQEFLSDGLAEELLNVLAKTRELRIIARTSSFYYKGKDVQIAQVARELGVDHVLEGSVRQVGDRIRVTAQLISAADSSHLWSETYDKTLDDVLAVEDEIASAVAQALRVNLLPRPKAVSPRAMEAHELYLRGRYLWHRSAEGDTERALEYFQRAAALNDQSADVWSALSGAWGVRVLRVGPGRQEASEKMLAAAERAVAIDPTLVKAQIRLSAALRLRGRDDLAARHLRRARQLDPDDPLVLGISAGLVWREGRLDDAIGFAERQVAVDPLSIPALVSLGHYLIDAGRYDASVVVLEKARELSPDRGTAYDIGIVRLLQGRLGEALELMHASVDTEKKRQGLVLVYHSLDRAAESEAALQQLIEQDGDRHPVVVAEAHAWRGDLDEAFVWMERAVEDRDDLGLNYRIWALQRNLRADPRWDPLWQRYRAARRGPDL